MGDGKSKVRKECTKEWPFPGKREDNEVWIHVDAELTDDDLDRFWKCPNCGLIIDTGPDIVKDNTCPHCGRETLERMGEGAFVRERCISCGYDDLKQSG